MTSYFTFILTTCIEGYFTVLPETKETKETYLKIFTTCFEGYLPVLPQRKTLVATKERVFERKLWASDNVTTFPTATYDSNVWVQITGETSKCVCAVHQGMLIGQQGKYCKCGCYLCVGN